MANIGQAILLSQVARFPVQSPIEPMPFASSQLKDIPMSVPERGWPLRSVNPNRPENSSRVIIRQRLGWQVPNASADVEAR